MAPDDRDEARKRLRAKLREKRDGRSSGGAASAPPRANAEDALLRVCGDDPQLMNLAHTLLHRPHAAADILRSIVPKHEEPDDEEEGLPPEGA